MLLLALLAACATFTDYVDEGTACFDDGDVVVTFPACATSTCDSVVTASCTATLVDGVLEVHGEARMKHQGAVCTEECLTVTARCEAPLIEDPDTVTMTYAGFDAALGGCTGDDG